MKYNRLIFKIWLNSEKFYRVFIWLLAVIPPVIFTLAFLWHLPILSPLSNSQEFQIKSFNNYWCYQYGGLEEGQQKNPQEIRSGLLNSAKIESNETYESSKIIQAWKPNLLEIVGLPAKIFEYQTCVSINVECMNFDFKQSGRSSPLEIEVYPSMNTYSGSGAIDQQKISLELSGPMSKIVVKNGMVKCFSQEFKSLYVIVNTKYFNVCPTDYISDLQKYGVATDCKNILTFNTASILNPVHLFIIVLLSSSLFWWIAVVQFHKIYIITKFK
ncbi:MAG: hypothetical protein PHX87_06085 [Candidatus Peribacteraceae bacterium]|nr:hypothetical protein [Candidatus Peribacteraceae bacterium]MDD5742959.1 hypothetical protein [Candidatus Peribacteraceae bacterium]